jgi:hypothetical protein
MHCDGLADNWLRTSEQMLGAAFAFNTAALACMLQAGICRHLQVCS